jgi:dUTP pyrophosphatase
MNEFDALIQSIVGLTEMEDELFDEEVMKTLLDNVEAQFSTELINQSINQIVQNFENQQLTKAEAIESKDALCELIKERIYGEHQFSANKKKFVDTIVSKLFNIFDEAVGKYHSYAIELPMMVDVAGGAKVPTYAHETDAAADLYAMEDQTIGPHTIGNKLRTGVKIQLPEGWLALIIPRSSIGAKTPLRLSNSVGLIDSGYRGELGVLYDNISNDPYEIKAGDRIAQLLVMPSYRFQAKVVDILADSDRGEGGFGSSGN